MGKRSSDEKVAIIDNDPMQLEMMRKLLDNINITPEMFVSAEEFYQSSGRFDLVITELILTDGSGFDICHFIKSKKETSDTFIMFVSAIDDSATITDAYSSGATGYLTKPIIPVELLCQVQSILSQAFLSDRLKNKSKQARSAAKSAMLESERLHHVIEFVRAASNVKHFSSMAALTFDLMAMLGFFGSIMFHVGEENHFFSDDGKEHEFERKLMMEIRKKVHTDPNHQTRFFSSKGRTAASFSRCSLFLRSTPKNQEDSLLDFLGLFMNQLDKAAENAMNERKTIQFLSDATQAITAVNIDLADMKKILESYDQPHFTEIRKNISDQINQISNRLASLTTTHPGST